jgi:D-aminoacyl-tRNA deacylase
VVRLRAMRALIQRVSHASVEVEENRVAAIDKGLLVFLGVGENDELRDIEYLVQKIIPLRIFSDAQGKMNVSIVDIQGELLVVSQFTLYADTKKGNRPSFIKSAPASKAKEMYETFIRQLQIHSQLKVESGIFGADMKVQLLNDGPVTIWMDSREA